MPTAMENRVTTRGRVLSVLMDEMRSTQIGVVGSPSDTNEITIDILETAEASRAGRRGRRG